MNKDVAAGVPLATIVAEGQYKLVETVARGAGFSAHKGIDIKSRGNAVVLVDCYFAPEAIKRVVEPLHQLTPERCAGFQGLFVEENKLYALFDFPAGKPLVKVFDRRTYPNREEAYRLAESLLHQALLLSPLPRLILGAATSPESLMLSRESGVIRPRMLLDPDGPERMEEIMRNLSRAMELLFRRRFGLLDFELDLLDPLSVGEFQSVSELYAAWREVGRQWGALSEKEQKASGFKHFIALLGQKWRRRKRAKAYREKRKALLEAAMAAGGAPESHGRKRRAKQR